MPLGCIIGLPVRVNERGNPEFSAGVRFANCLQSLAPPMNYQTKTLTVPGKRIDDARNEIVRQALQDNAEHVLFLDTDVIFPPHAFQQLLLRHRNNPEHKIISGVYWSKSNPCFPLIFHEAGRGSFMDWRIGDYIKAGYAIGMGLSLIHTDVFRAMEPPWFLVNYGFSSDSETGLGMSSSLTEDLYFCEKAGNAGYEIWVDTSIQAGHYDSFSGVTFGLNESFPQAQRRDPAEYDTLYIGDMITGGENGHVLSENPRIKPTWVAPPEKIPTGRYQRYGRICVKDVDILPEALPEAVVDWVVHLKDGHQLEVLHPDFAEIISTGVALKRKIIYGPQVYEAAMTQAGLVNVKKEKEGSYWHLYGYKRECVSPLVSIIVVAHGLEEMTNQCVRSLREGTTGDFSYEVVLVDNGSPKPLPKMGDKQVRLNDNIPYGAAVQRGIDAADEDSVYLLFLNNDTVIVQENWLENLLKRIRGQYRIAAVGPKQISQFGTIHHTEIGFDDNRVPYHKYHGFGHDHPTVQVEKETLALNFGCVLLRREIFDKLGGFDERFALAGNYEDIDWCLRARKEGHGLLYTPSSQIVHFGAATFQDRIKREGDKGKDWHDRSLVENQKRFVERWKDEKDEFFREGE